MLSITHKLCHFLHVCFFSNSSLHLFAMTTLYIKFIMDDDAKTVWEENKRICTPATQKIARPSILCSCTCYILGGLYKCRKKHTPNSLKAELMFSLKIACLPLLILLLDRPRDTLCISTLNGNSLQGFCFAAEQELKDSMVW